MWYLKSTYDGSLYYFLLGKAHRVNRKGGDLVLQNDQSISRAHAIIDVTATGEVYISDEGSKYGTYINDGIGQNAKIENNQTHKIKNGDKVRFGLQWNVWQLHYKDIVVCTSTIAGEEKQKLISALTKIGAKLSNDWHEHCTHLVMNAVTLTRKVVYALACAKPITTVAYWMQFLSAVENQTSLPEEKDFQPPVVEVQLKKENTLIIPSKERKSLFKDKVFVFSSEEIKNKNKMMVEYAGGRCVSGSNQNITPESCCAPNHIVVVEPGENIPDGSRFKAIISALQKKGLRTIPFSEIGLSIYVESTEKYCNPSFRRRNILGDSQSQVVRGICLVENTEDISLQSQDIRQEEAKQGIVIPPSFPSCPSRDLEPSNVEKRTPQTSVPDTRSPKTKSNQWLEKTQPIRCPQDDPKTSTTTVFSRQTTIPSASTSKDDSHHVMFGLGSPKRKSKSGADSCTTQPSPAKSRSEGSSTMDITVTEDPFRTEPPGLRTSTQKSRTGNGDRDGGHANIASTREFRVSTRKRQVEEDDDDDDPFLLPSTSNLQNSRKRRQIPDDDEEDQFRLPSTEGVRQSTKRRQVIDDDEHDDPLRPTEGAKKSTKGNTQRRPPASKSSTSRQNNDDIVILPVSPKSEIIDDNDADENFTTVGEASGRADPLELNEQDKKRKARVQLMEESRVKKRNKDTQIADTSENKKRPITLANFIDRSMGSLIKVEKKEELGDGEDEERDEESLCDMIGKITVEEVSLVRERRPLVQLSRSNGSINDGRPNFKRFKKAQLRPNVTNRRITLILETSDGRLISDEPDDPSEITATQPADSQILNVESIFPRIHPENIRERRGRVDDEWALPM